MPGVFDSWNLSNSRAIPQYQGSTIPELTKVADTLQNRYDVGQQQADLLDQSIKTSTASSFDQPLLSSLKAQYRDKLQGYADKGNYEDMWRNVAMDARDFSGHVKTIQANQQNIQGFYSDLDKRVGEGKLDPSVAAARKAQVQDTYNGLKMDPETSQLTNMFNGPATVPSVDIPEKVNKWLQDSHAVERGWKAEKDENGWYVTNGTDRKSLPWSTIKPIIDSGVSLDPEVQGWLRQEHELAPYYHGISAKLPDSTVKQMLVQSPQLASMVQPKIDQGMAPTAALHSVLGDEQVRQRMNEIYGYAHKGIVDEQKGEYGERMDEVTAERLKKQGEHNMFSVPFADVSPGTTISLVNDFDNERSKAFDAADKIGQEFGAFRNAPGVSEKNGQMLRTNPDGSTTDITADANNYRQQISSAMDKVHQLDSIKKAAADATNYHPEQMTAGQQKEMKTNEDQLYQQYSNQMLQQAQSSDYRTIALSPQQQATAHQMAHESAISQRNTNHPAYNDYQQELIKRLQPQGEGNKLWVFNDDAMKKTLGDFASNAISDLGLKQGLVSLKMASGKNAGDDLSASDYDDLQGKMVPVGIYNDAKTGDTKIMMRALQDIKGKKIKGENMVVSMKDVGGVDDYMRTHTSPQEYHNFVMDRTLKSGLNNVAGTTNFPITDNKGVNQMSVQVTRKKGSNQGPGSFSVRIPTSSGYKQLSADSYEGVTDIIQRLQDHYNGGNNTTNR